MEIEDAYSVSTAEYSPVVILFSSSKDKRIAFQAKSKLNQITGEDNRGVFLNDYLPATENEKRRRNRDIVNSVKAENPGKKIEVEYTKTGIRVQGQLYQRAVVPPNPTTLLDMSVNELDKIMATNLHKGPEVRKDGNRFIAYSMDVNSHQPIRDAYMKLCLVHTRARHIICAYNIPDRGPQFQDFCDDQEAASARALLKDMIKSNICFKVIFIVRFCGMKLGAERIPTYLQAAKEVMKKFPKNALTGEPQSFKVISFSEHDPQDNKHKKTSEKKNDDTSPKVRASPGKTVNKAKSFASAVKTSDENSAKMGESVKTKDHPSRRDASKFQPIQPSRFYEKNKKRTPYIPKKSEEENMET